VKNVANISKDGVATHLLRDGIINDNFISDSVPSIAVKEF